MPSNRKRKEPTILFDNLPGPWFEPAADTADPVPPVVIGPEPLETGTDEAMAAMLFLFAIADLAPDDGNDAPAADDAGAAKPSANPPQPALKPAPEDDNSRPGVEVTIGSGTVSVPGKEGRLDGGNDFDGSAVNDQGYDINGNDKANKIIGTKFRDSIKGGGGDDVIDGGAGNDWIHGGTGNDTITGGPGKDTFVWQDGDGDDVITDFKPGEDKLDLFIGNLDPERLIANGKQVGKDFVISFPLGGSITLKNVDGKKLTENYFGFIVADAAPPNATSAEKPDEVRRLYRFTPWPEWQPTPRPE